VRVISADPDAQDQVRLVTKNLVPGHFRGLGSEEIVIVYERARDLKVSTGDRICLTPSTKAVRVFIIAGLYNQDRAVAVHTSHCGRRRGYTAWASLLMPSWSKWWISLRLMRW
jgi:hypothetical protein